MADETFTGAKSGAETASAGAAKADTARGAISEGVRSSTGAYELVFSAAILSLVGLGLDTLLGVRPILTVTFALVGVAGAIVSIYFRYREAMKQQARPK